jgi:FAD binding domain/Berberine and berberine like
MKNASSRRALAAAHDLGAVMQGIVVLPGEGASSTTVRGSVPDAYASARQIWNDAVDHRPALIALCRSVEDVQVAVRAARAHALPLSVRGGGHDWAGRALRHDGLVIDLSAMRRVEIDPQPRVATVAGGARATDVIAAAAPHGLVAVTGSCGTVGMAGLTLGGGYGMLTPQYGLALDNLLGAELVLADGRLVAADASENADLFWALRGGGGNFGVVTSMLVRLHEVREVLAGLIMFPWSEAATVLRRYAEMVASAPDELGVLAGVLSRPDGSPVVFLAPTWSGDSARGERVMNDLQNLATPLMAQTRPMAYGDMVGQFDAFTVNGRHYELQTRWLPELTSDAISSIIAAGGDRTSPHSAIALHHFRGAGTRLPGSATAFGLRREHVLVEAIAGWEPGIRGDDSIRRQWARSLSRNLAPFALPGGYPNLLGPDEHEQIAVAYGGNAARLREVKQRFDPEGIFTSAIALPASAPVRAPA